MSAYVIDQQKQRITGGLPLTSRIPFLFQEAKAERYPLHATIWDIGREEKGSTRYRKPDPREPPEIGNATFLGKLLHECPLCARHKYRWMKDEPSIVGAVINESGVHWAAIAKHENRLWHVDSCVARPILLTEATFDALIRGHRGTVFYVQLA